MALKPLHAVFLTVILCALLALAWLPPEPRPLVLRREVSTTALLERRIALTRMLNREVWSYNASARLDSLRQPLVRALSETAGAPALLIGSDILPATRESIRRAVALHWQRLGVDSARFPVAVVVLSDTAPGRQALPSGVNPNRSAELEHLLLRGDTLGLTACVAMVLLRERVRSAASVVRLLSGGTGTLDEPAQTLAGPCAFFAAHGAPGPRIHAWLEARGYDVALASDWSRRMRSNWREERARTMQLPAGLRVSATGIGGRACLLGELDVCERDLRQRHEDAGDPPRLAGAYRTTGLRRGWNWLGASFLGEIRQAIGADRFEVFWTSSDEPQSAFAAATGENMSKWTRDWALDYHGRAVPGARVPALVIVVGLMIGAGGMGAAALVSSRRTVR